MATNYKILGQAAPSSTANVDLYTVPAGKESVVSTVVVTNTSAASANATIYVRKDAATAADGNVLIKAAAVPTADFKAITIGITLDAGDVVTVASSTASALTFHAFGTEIA